MAEVHLGIDIGSTKVAAVLAQSRTVNNSTIYEIIGAGKAFNEGVFKGNINNTVKTKEAIRKALEIAASKANMPYLLERLLVATVNVSGTQLETLPASITCGSSEVTSQDVANLFKDIHQTYHSESNQIVHLLPLKFAVGDQHDINDPVGHTGLKLNGNFNVITAKKSSLQQIKESLQKAQIKIEDEDGFAASPLVAALALLTDAHKELGVVVVDIGGGTTDIAIYHEGLLRHTSVLPFGGNHITDDIKQGCHLPFDSAEEAKTTISETDPNACSLNQLLIVPTADGIPPIEVVARNIVLIIRARLREIAALVLAEIRKAGFDERSLRAGIVLTGGTAHLNGIENVFREVTKMHVQIGIPKGLDRTNAPLYDAVVSDPSYSTALGLAMLSMPSMSLDRRIRKLPKQEVEKKKTGGGFFKFGIKDMTNIREVGSVIWRGLTQDDIGSSDSY